MWVRHVMRIPYSHFLFLKPSKDLNVQPSWQNIIVCQLFSTLNVQVFAHGCLGYSSSIYIYVTAKYIVQFHITICYGGILFANNFYYQVRSQRLLTSRRSSAVASTKPSMGRLWLPTARNHFRISRNSDRWVACYCLRQSTSSQFRFWRKNCRAPIFMGRTSVPVHNSLQCLMW